MGWLVDLNVPYFGSILVVLFHVSGLVAFLALLLRDQMQLRLLLGLSLLLQGLYYYAVPGGPLFGPLIWLAASLIANVAMIALVLGGKLDFGVPEDMRPLFTKMAVLTPGQFRRLTARAVRVPGGGAAILTEGMKPDRLYYLLKGEAQYIKNRQTTNIQPGTFLGEIAFLSDLPAAATIVLAEGSECIAWNRAALLQLMKKDPAIDIAMRGFFSHEVAYKMTRNSQPAAVPDAPRRASVMSR